MKALREELELRRKTEIHEIEEVWKFVNCVSSICIFKKRFGGGVGVDKLQSYRKVFVNSKRNKKIFSFSCTKPFHIGNDFA